MAAKTETLFTELPAAILGLGQALPAMHGIRPRTNPAGPDQITAMENRVLAMVKANANARRLVGIRERGQGDSEKRVRLRAFAMLAFQSLGQPAHLKSDISDVAQASMDKKLQPGEALLQARHIIGKMVVAEQFVAGMDGDGVCSKVHLPLRALEWLAGGKSSMGFLTTKKLLGHLIPGLDDVESPPETQAIPSARKLYEQVRELVIGCDPQLKTLASRISLHAARADLLARGIKDTGVGNQVILIFGSSGSGKTFAVRELARFSNLGFASFDASTITGEGWAGSKVENVLIQALTAVNGDPKRASNSIICYDEADKIFKANSTEHRLSVQAEFLRPLGGETVVVGGKRSQDCRPFSFDCAPTCFVFLGVFNGLTELACRGGGHKTIGFHSVVGEKRHADFRRALSEYGCIDELCNRISCVIGLPDPTSDSIAKAIVSEHGIVEGFNAVLSSRDIVLFPEQPGVSLLADYGVQTGTFFRGVKHIIGSIVEEVLFDGAKGTIMLDASLVRRAINRTAEQDAGHGIKSSNRNQSCWTASEGGRTDENGEAEKEA